MNKETGALTGNGTVMTCIGIVSVACGTKGDGLINPTIEENSYSCTPSNNIGSIIV